LQVATGRRFVAMTASCFADLTATGSYFVGRTELMAGWRYTKVGAADAFNGPTAGLRLWF
jgi:hypothetical protein